MPPRPPGEPDGPHPIDVYVGQRVKLRRTLLGLSQEKLGDAVGLTFQQIQKYERGANRIAASKLYELSQVLDVPVSYFFDDLPPEARRTAGLAEEAPPAYAHEDGESPSAEIMRLVKLYNALPPDARRVVYTLIKDLAAWLAGPPAADDAAAAPPAGGRPSVGDNHDRA